MAFPCLDKREQKNIDLGKSCSLSSALSSSLDTGPEPLYSFVQSGFDVYRHKQPIFLDYGGHLLEHEVAYESWGTLNKDKSNLILVHTGLSASSHAKSQPNNRKSGWWENFIGDGKYLDTSKYFVVCTNVLGGCYGSTGPSLKDPMDGQHYGTRFPILSIFDMVRAQRQMISLVFGVSKIYALVGASMGGMQLLAYASEFPNEVEKVVSISGCARSHPYSIALRHTQRQVLMADPNWNRGFYYDKIPPHVGMKLAREIATVTYRLGPEWEYRFGRNRADDLKPPALCPDFLVETYLDHAGEKFCLEYDANSLLYVLKAMDLFDMGHAAYIRAKETREELKKQYVLKQTCGANTESLPQKPYQETNGSSITREEALDDLKQGMRRIREKGVLIIGVESDGLFPVWQQREIAETLSLIEGNNTNYLELGNDVSNYGHDTFLLSLENFGPHVKSFLEST